MSKIFIGSVINGFKILKKVFNSIVPNRCIYKVKCLACGAKYKLRLIDIESETCNCKEKAIKELDSSRHFSKDMKENIGIRRGKYTVVGYMTKPNENPAPSMKYKTKLYIVKCNKCGELVIMSSNNLNAFREKRDKGTRCMHKRFFDITLYDSSDFYIDWELVSEC